MKVHSLYAAVALACALVLPAHAQLNQSNQCPPTATNCTGSNQNSGDTSTVYNNGDTHSTSAAPGNSQSAVTNGNQINPEFDNRAQTTQNANNTTTGTISGGNTNSSATGGSANGNISSNDNRSSVGNTSSNSGGNTMTGGANTATTGNNTNTVGGSFSGGNTLNNGSSSGGNTLAGGNNTATNTATGGAGGQGGAGGAGGSATGGAGGSAGVDRSGNSANQNTAAQGQQMGQGQGQSSDNRNANGQGQGQSSTNASRSGVGGSGNSQTGVQLNTGGNSYTSLSTATAVSKTTVWAPVVHGQTAAPLASASMMIVPSQCGPRVRVERINIEGHRVKSFWPDTTLPNGWTEVLVNDYEERQEWDPMSKTWMPVREDVPFKEVKVGGKKVLMGSQFWEKAAVIGTSTGSSFSLGGFGRNGDGGQGGAAASGQLQRQVSQYTVRDCIYAEEAQAQPAPVAAARPLPVIPAPGQ